MSKHSLLLAALLCPLLLHAENGKPAPGSYGFDWLKPLSSKCRKLSAQDIERLGTCTPPPRESGFGRYAPTHVCRVNARSEWMIYASQKQCREEFSTMEANAP